MERNLGKYHTQQSSSISRNHRLLNQSQGCKKPSGQEVAIVLGTKSGKSRVPSDAICPKRDPPTLTPEMLLNLKKQYMTLKLRKLMAVEIIKNRVKGDLKRIVKQMNAQVQSNSKEFVVLGGGTKSLSYLKTPHSSRLGGGSGFTLEVDVRGYIPDNVSVDTANNHMSIRATKVNGVEKALSLLAPSTAALEKVKIYPPTNGFLLIKYPNNEQESAY